jgi:hypothetical protein
MTLRTLLTVALVAPAAPLAAPAAKPAAPIDAQGGLQGLSIGGFLGYETDTLSGVSLRADGELPSRDLSPWLRLSWVGSLGYARLSKKADYFGVELTTTADIVKLVPAARLTVPLHPAFSVFGDLGLGLYYAKVASETYDIFLRQTVPSNESRVNVLMRLGVGGWYEVNPKLRIGGMLELDPYFGAFDQNTFLIQLGAMFGT